MWTLQEAAFKKRRGKSRDSSFVIGNCPLSSGKSDKFCPKRAKFIGVGVKLFEVILRGGDLTWAVSLAVFLVMWADVLPKSFRI